MFSHALWFFYNPKNKIAMNKIFLSLMLIITMSGCTNTTKQDTTTHDEDTVVVVSDSTTEHK